MSKAELKLITGERQAGESDKAVQACNDYLRLGPGRSISLLLDRYSRDTTPGATSSRNTLETWSRKYHWQDRASDFDIGLDEQQTADRQRSFKQGLSLDYQRLNRLKRLARLLEKQIYETDEAGQYFHLWLKDAKLIDGERLDIVRFNGALVDQLRGVLDDIARETGGRQIKTGKDADPKPPNLLPGFDISELSDEDLAALDAILSKYDTDQAS